MLTKHLTSVRTEHTEIEQELHDKAHIDYNRVAIVSALALPDVKTFSR